MTDGRAKNGGQRKGAGRHRQVFKIDKGTAKELFILVGHHRGFQPEATEESVLATLIRNAAYDLAQHEQHMAQELQEAEQS